MTLIMVDPDVPSRYDPYMGQWRYWIVADVKEGLTKNGLVLSNYTGPSPPQNTGYHRYIFILYNQEHSLSDVKQVGDEYNQDFDLYDYLLLSLSNRGLERAFFSIADFAKINGLGNPVGVNYFYAANAATQDPFALSYTTLLFAIITTILSVLLIVLWLWLI
jgi:hypothetical protein